MSLYSSMATAISGLEANSQMLTVVSDNIVNSNTHGFKTARGEFHDFVAKDLLTAGGQQIGNGVTMAGVTTLFSQGAISQTERNTDVALNGSGFFVVRTSGQGYTYTRDGSLRFDKQGWLTTLNGDRVQAYEGTPEGRITGKLGDVRIPYDTIPAKATNRVQVHLNLDARQQVNSGFDWDKPQETAQFSSAVQVHDSLGNSHNVNLFFNKTDDGAWDWVAMADGADMAGGTPGKLIAVAQGSLFYDAEGKLDRVEQVNIDTSFANGAVPDQDLTFDFGDAIDEGGTGVKGSTQYGAKNAVFRNIQDGNSSGVLLDVNVDAEGVISGIYSNGISKPIAQMAVARFEASERLRRVGGNQFRETVESGAPMLGKPNTNGRGYIVTRSLERSNVDLAKEFIDMIRAQRGFQSSAKSINVANEMLDEVIAIANRR